MTGPCLDQMMPEIEGLLLVLAQYSSLFRQSGWYAIRPSGLVRLQIPEQFCDTSAWHMNCLNNRSSTGIHMSERAVLPSAVKVETNWRLRISAFILGSLWRMSPSFSGEMPNWSHLRDLTRAPSLVLELGSLLTRSAMCWLYACLQTFCASLRSRRKRSQSRCLLVRRAFLCALAFRLMTL